MVDISVSRIILLHDICFLDAVLTQLVLEGGADLVDDLCLSSHCLLGENIVTSGYRLPANSEI